ncbi:large conductance mechanosensitive channel protein MscL [Bdellovibrio bacteriovorus]|uniref:Large-conductance mechanosensitive channel n=1 Tax=Bdellovibrio bacteriovorus (strain ATCC 15356 / DSM 50701 / NCIMB 9529 / HD100) TaxID=264462 RepID=MSCL_BDEBA|nr:large conductance mechanosensitive channel protein MscL [Bdellovibrio bacteriovorus]Q6MRC6.1 RecName: Full=Large-conductance mechanosensitive channel [Bdellovibrio bacteriovorus HD100]AHZ85808.1 mechanosensitive ion channel protein MscL [Bdellovibrio bacteriovorus]BEV66728.1 Large-conductance mechanosensitive channel [Bdellovibrio bacteriovorus]CAE77832.1 large conductance mechanosensitive channel [Bdellovibrio bacteriovorus HD100]
MFKEFKTFIMRGNVLDMAVGIIIGAAFGKIVTSFVTDVLTPVLSLGMGKVDFSNLFFVLNGDSYPTLDAAKAAGVATLNYGTFLNVVLDFVIVAFSIFLIIKAANKLKRAEEPAPVTTKECPECCSSIPMKARKCAHCGSAVAS